MKPTVLITQRVFPETFQLLDGLFNVISPKETAFSKEEIIERVVDCDAILSIFNQKIDADIIDAGKNLKIISNFGVGFDNVDVAYATKKGIVVTNTPDPVIDPTAELAFGLMLAVARRISELDRKLRQKDLVKWGVLENMTTTLVGKTLGIIGFGRIGQALARRGVASDMNIVYHNRKPVLTSIENIYNAEYLSMDELLRNSDFVSLHVPYTAETFHLIDENELMKMKSTAFLINTARGSVVNEKALVNALRNKTIAGAAIDVYEKEPFISEELLSMDNIVLSPHSGTATYEGRNAMGAFACQNIIRFFQGDDRITRVN